MIQVIGQIKPPPGVENWIGRSRVGGFLTAPGLLLFVSTIIKLLIVIAGLYAFFNIVLAGYGFLNAGDDPKKMTAAWAKIWQSAMGLVVIAGSFILTAIISYLIFGDPSVILKPSIYGPE
jgi:hypothetical protein